MVIALLFNKEDLSRFIRKREQDLHTEIDTQTSDYLLKIDVSEYVEHLYQKYLLEPPQLDEKKIYVDQGEEKIDISQDRNRAIFDRNQPFHVKGVKISFFIPFQGHSFLFDWCPSSFNLNRPRAKISDQQIIIDIASINHEQEEVKAEFDRTLKSIKQWLSWVSSDSKPFNDTLKQKIEEKIKNKREKFIKDKGLAASFGFPLKKRENASQTYTVPTVQKKILPKKPEVSKASPLEPALNMEHYENILQIVTNMTMVMERSPKAFKTMGEENIRDHFLVQLNGQYKGQATGETFNFTGKTDIIIRHEGKNIFISECKFWKGKKQLKDAIDQLLGYTSWRDTKTAILLFNRNKDLTKVLSQIPEIVKEHENFIKQIDYNSETGFRFVLKHNDDKERELYLTVLVFEVPQ